MNTITLEYDNSNSTAIKMLEQILTSGFFKVSNKQNKIDISLEEEKMGLVNSYDSLDDFIKKNAFIMYKFRTTNQFERDYLFK